MPQLRRCAACGLVLQHPRPTREELDAIYQAAYYDSWGEREGGRQYWEIKKQLYVRLLCFAGLSRGEGRALDLGCATGAGLDALKDMGFAPVGLDVNPHAVALSSERVPGAEVLVSTLEAAPFDSGSFDCIVLSDVIEHVDDPKGILSRAFDLLRPGGRAVFLTPNVEALSCKVMRGRWVHFKQEHLVYFAPRTLGRLLQQAGFRVQAMGRMSKPLNLAYAVTQFISYPHPILTPAAKFLRLVAPDKLFRRVISLPMGEMAAVAIKPEA